MVKAEQEREYNSGNQLLPTGNRISQENPSPFFLAIHIITIIVQNLVVSKGNLSYKRKIAKIGKGIMMMREL